MKWTISVLMLLVVVSFACAEVNHYYEIEILYENEELSTTPVQVVPSDKEMVNLGETYTAEVVDFNDKKLAIIPFAIPLTVIWDSIDSETGEITGGGMKKLNESEVTIYVPYYENAKEIMIYDSEKVEKLVVSIAEFAKEVPAEVEVEVVEKEIGEEPKVKDIEEVAKGIPIWVWVVVGIGALFLLIVIVLILLRGRN